MKSVALVGDNAFGSDELHGATGSVVLLPTQSGVEPPRFDRPPTFLVPRQSGKSSQLKNFELSDLLVRSTIGPPHFGQPCARLEPAFAFLLGAGFAGLFVVALVGGVVLAL